MRQGNDKRGDMWENGGMATNESTEQIVQIADEWLAEHRVSESWRLISSLRDALVRTLDGR